MKKVLSLLLICTMVFSLVSVFAVSANDTYGYVFKAAKIEAKKSGKNYKLNFDTTATEYGSGLLYDSNYENSTSLTAIAVAVSADTFTSAGHFVLDYDNAKLIPAVLYADATDGVYGLAYNDLDGDSSEKDFVQMQAPEGPQGSDTATNAGLQITNSQIALTWMANATTGGVNANEIIAYLTFFLKEGVTVANLDANTIKVATDCSAISDDVITAKAKAAYGVCYMSTKAGDVSSVGGNIATIKPVFGSDSGEGGDTKEDDVWEAGTTSEESLPTITFKGVDGTEKTEYAGKKLVIFGKNTKNAESKTALNADDYYVVIGNNKYFGKAEVTGQYWAIVILDENGVKVARDSYDYEAYVNGVKVGDGTVNAD